MFRSDNTEKIEFNIDDYENTLIWVKNCVDKIRSNTDWDKSTDDFFCNNLCDYRNACDK